MRENVVLVREGRKGHQLCSQRKGARCSGSVLEERDGVIFCVGLTLEVVVAVEMVVLVVAIDWDVKMSRVTWWFRTD